MPSKNSLSLHQSLFTQSSCESLKKSPYSVAVKVYFLTKINQHEQPPLCCSAWDEWLDDFRLTSTISPCFAEESVSIPGNAAEIFRNSGYKFTKYQTLFQRSLKIFKTVIRIDSWFSHLDVKSSFCTRLYEYHSKITSFVIPFFYRHLPVKMSSWW